MRNRFKVVGCIAVLALSLLAIGAGTITMTPAVQQDRPAAERQYVLRHAVAWTSNASGAASGVLTNSDGNAYSFNGTLLQAAFQRRGDCPDARL
jgi:hypothetical protein